MASEEIEYLILEDLEKWCSVNVLNEDWDEYFAKLRPSDHQKELSRLMEIYFKDHIFSVDNYI